LMNEENDLPLPHRKKIAWFHEHLDRWNHYELLQVNRTAQKSVIRKAYYERSKEWHPDRFRFADNLGSFKPLLDQIFDRIRTAHIELSDDSKRKIYDAVHAPAVSESDIAEILNARRREEREKKREVEKNERRKKKNPMRKRIDRARSLIEDARREREAGDSLKALGLAQMAGAYDMRPEYQTLIDELKKEAADARIAPLLKRALHFESMTRWAEAVHLLEEAVRVAPAHGNARVRLAFNMARGGMSPQSAIPHAQKGVHLAPDEPEAHFVLGLCYHKAGETKASVHALKRAIDLKENFKEAKKLLRELTWGF
ncbi:MAG: DnaJ domain-containing protein, partial [Myxococcota bacterium]